MTPLARSFFLAASLAGALLSGPPALAAPVVLYGTAGSGPAPDAATAAAQARDALRSGSFRVEGEIAGLPELADSALLAAGASLRPCPEHVGATLAARVEAAATQVDDLDFEGALATLAATGPDAACAPGELTPELLYDLWFLAGYARFFSGDEPGARALFFRAAATDPGRRWNEDYPPTPKAAFLGALQDALGAPGAAVETAAPIPGLRVDGRDAGEAIPALPAGPHVLDLGGRRWLLDLPAAQASQPVLLATGAEVRPAILSAEEWTAPLLRDIAASRGWTDLVIASDLGTVRFRDGAFVERRFVVGGARATATAGLPPRTRIAGVVMLGGGAAAAAVGFGVHGSAWQAGRPVQEDPSSYSREAYEPIWRRNVAGFAVGVAGAGVAAAGLVLALLPSDQGTADLAWRPRPSFAAGPGWLNVGLQGSFR